MIIYLVSRHPGVIDWLAQSRPELAPDMVLAHLPKSFGSWRNVFIGNLPMSLVAKITSAGGRYISLDLVIPPEKRGIDLTKEMMQECGASLTEYKVFKV